MVAISKETPKVAESAPPGLIVLNSLKPETVKKVSRSCLFVHLFSCKLNHYQTVYLFLNMNCNNSKTISWENPANILAVTIAVLVFLATRSAKYILLFLITVARSTSKFDFPFNLLGLVLICHNHRPLQDERM